MIFNISCSPYSLRDKSEILDEVDPFVGTGFHGHTFPGATTPHGMVQLSPDTRTSGWDACAGYHYSDSSIIGFSHTHLSGTGIGDLGDILFMPFTGDPPIVPGSADNPNSGYRSGFNKLMESASPGYYRVFLDRYGINVELTATPRVGFHRYTFPEATEAGIIVDLAHNIYEHENPELYIRVVNNQEIEGMKHSKGWADFHLIYFHAVFSKPFIAELYDNDTLVTGMTELRGTNIKAKLKFNTNDHEIILAKVGISPVDIDGAKKNIRKEIPGWNFNIIHQSARDSWEDQLSIIQIKGGKKEDRKVFYTALYHALISPNIYSDIDSRYRGMDQKIHRDTTFKNYTVFSLWDTFRGLHPLLTIINPELNNHFIKALLRKYQEGGILPMWELESNYTGTMIGYHAVSVIVDAFMKGAGDFNTELALKAALQSSHYDTTILLPFIQENVRKQLIPEAKFYAEHMDYIPANLENGSVSRGLEYCYNDWLIGQMSKKMEYYDIAQIYFKRSQNYVNYFDTTTSFMRDKNLGGSWVNPFNPRYSDHLHSPYVEGNAWQWSWFVPHDIEGLINLYGGQQEFINKLDSLFSGFSQIEGENASADITGLIGQYAHGNEPGHHIIYLYNYVDQPWKTQDLVSKVIRDFYSYAPDGLIGNEDCGQMSAWYLFSAMGFYPVCPGDTRFSLGKPLFDELCIKLGKGKTFYVKMKNGGPKNPYVQCVSLNGKPLISQFIGYDDIAASGRLVFKMGSEKTVFWKNQ